MNGETVVDAGTTPSGRRIFLHAGEDVVQDMLGEDDTRVCPSCGQYNLRWSAGEVSCLACGLEGEIISPPEQARPLTLKYHQGPQTADMLLTRAAQHMKDRASTYDKPDGERSMTTAVIAFNAITGKYVTEAEGWLLLQLLKDVRQWHTQGYHADSAEDCIAYAALKAEALQRADDHPF